MSDGVYTIEQISQSTWKIVENDHFGQYPFLYVIMGVDKCILIDTGCGTADYLAFVSSQVNKSSLPYLVINTHVHFDHVGGNHQFCNHNKCLGICMGGNNQTFSNNVDINSLAMAHHGAQVKKYEVSRWLQEGEFIYLDDANQTKENSLEILFTPGHTPDSIAIYNHKDRRLFVGDTIYPFTVIHLDCVGSSLSAYMSSLNKLITFVKQQGQINKDSVHSGAETEEKNALSEPVHSQNVENATSSAELTLQQKKAISDVMEMLGLRKEDVKFNLKGLMELCDWSIEQAINFYLSSPQDVEAMCPPVAEVPKPIVKNFIKSDEIQMSCGHVEANFAVANLENMVDLLNFIIAGAVPPVRSDGEYSEYTNETVSVMISRKEIAKINDQLS